MENIKFELGKYYKHNGGQFMYICGLATTRVWGTCFIGEDQYGCFTPVGFDVDHASNWREITKEEFIKTGAED